MTRRALTPCLLAAGLTLIAVAFGAEVTQALLRATTLAERAQHAQWIVIGTVQSQTSRWDPQQSLPVTEVTLAIAEALKSPAGMPLPDSVVVRVPGGRRGRLTVQVSDTPSFRRDERFIVFLREAPAHPQVYQPVAGTQGVYPVRFDHALQQDIIVNNAGAFLVALEPERYEPNAAIARRITVSQFAQHVQHLLDAISP